MTNETQETIDLAYQQGKASYFRAVGTHGPTLKPRAFISIPNPYPVGTLCREAWQRGYNQDTRRVVAGITKPTIIRIVK